MTSRLLDTMVDDSRPILLDRDGARVTTSSGSLLEAGGGSHATCIVNDGGTLMAGIQRALGAAPGIGTARPYVHPVQIELAERVVTMAGDPAAKVYFTSGGSEAFETALRLAFHLHRTRGQGHRSLVVGHRFSYHGMTLAARNASDHPDHGPGPGEVDFRWPKLAGGDAAEIERDALLLERQGKDIAAVVIEPVSGTTGGATVRSADYLQWLAGACRRHGIILIIDEVVTAFGRTGAGFCSAWLQPDIILGGKCLGAGYTPIGCVLLSGLLCEELKRSGEPLPLRLTFSANMTACAVAATVQHYCAEHGLFEAVAARGPLIADFLAAACAQRSTGFTHHGIGHLWGLHARLPLGEGRPALSRLKLRAQQDGIEFMGGTKSTGSYESVHMTLTPAFDLTDAQLWDLLASALTFFEQGVSSR